VTERAARRQAHEEDRRTDRELVYAARDGDMLAFDALFYRYRDGIFRLGLAITKDPSAAEEIAVDTFTRALSNEVAGQGVRVCAVRPGLTLTEIFESTLGQEGAAELARRAVPMGRIGQPDEVAAMVLWLCSSEASYVTGFTYDVSGGR